MKRKILFILGVVSILCVACVCTACDSGNSTNGAGNNENHVHHSAAEPIEENRVDANCTSDGSYDMVVYCSVCGKEISREHKTIVATGVHEYRDGVCSVCGATEQLSVVFYLEDGETVYYAALVNFGDSVLLPTEDPKDQTKRKDFLGWGKKEGDVFSETAYEFANGGTTLENVRENMEFRALFGDYIYTPICP